MALPVTISTAFYDQNYFVGPFIDGNGNVYTVGTEDNDIEMFKATDPTDSFSEQDVAGAPGCGVNAIGMFQDDDVLRVATYGFSLPLNLEYSIFHTSDNGATPDEWVIANEQIEEIADQSPSGELSVSIVARSDGTVVVIYNGDEDSVMGNPYARVDYNIRSSGGSWGGPVTLVADEKAEIDWHGSVAVLDTSDDKTHFFYSDTTSADGKHASLTSGDSLSSIEDVDLAVAAVDHIFTPGFYTLDGSTDRVRIGYLDGNDKISLCRIDDDGSPAITIDISDNTVFDVNGSPAACLAVDGTDGHMLYSNNADQDLFHDTDPTPHTSTNWGTDTEELDAVTINRISFNVYTRSGDVVGAYVYDDAGTIKYNEFVITAGGATNPGWFSSGGWF